MRRLPRDGSGRELAKAMAAFGYRVTRQSGSHLRLTTSVRGEHHVTVPNHPALRIGTLASIITSIQAHFEIDRDGVLDRLFGEG